MTTENKNDKDFDDSMTSEGGAATKADGAIRDTAQKYLDRSGIRVDLHQIEESIEAVFAALPGDSSTMRHCNQCDLEVVNYDALDAVGRQALLTRPAERLCVSAAIPGVSGRQCPRSRTSLR